MPYGSSVHVHTFSGGLIAANGGEDKVDWEPMPSSKQQVVWTVPGNCRLSGIVGMCYFSQMRWPVGVFLSSPSFLIMCTLVWVDLYQGVCLGVVGHGPQSFDTKDLAQFLNYTTDEASASIT